MTNETTLTKRDVARRQLVTAINLLFENRDRVSIYTLAANAWEIIDSLCNKPIIESFSNQTRENLSAGEDLKHDYINKPYRNFFKHADRDPNSVLPYLNEKTVDSVVFLAVEDYIRLYKQSPIELQVFQLWYLAVNPSKIASQAIDKAIKNIQEIFPGIEKLERARQIEIANQTLKQALSDEHLISDPRTELSI
ncbi:MAG: hypothetical protein QM709_10995 [Spongiibacteraceae bacterium]